MNLGIECFQAFFGGLVGLFLKRLTLHFELDQAAIKAIHRLWLGVQLHTNPRGGFVDQVNGLIGQLTISDIAGRELGCSNNRRIGNIHAVVHFVALFQAAKDRHGVLFGRLINQHLLEAALQSSVFLNVLAVLIKGGRPHAVQLAAGQGRLEHIACIHGTFGFACADHGVQLVNKQDHPAFFLGKLLEHRFQALFKLTTEFGTRQ